MHQASLTANDPQTAPLKIVTKLVGAILATELVIMLVIDTVLKPALNDGLTPLVWDILDPVLLVILLSPFIYYLVFRPVLTEKNRLRFIVEESTTDLVEAQKQTGLLRQEADIRADELQKIMRVVDAHCIVSMTDNEGRITRVNDLFCSVSGYGKEELMGQNHRILKSDVHAPAVFDDLWKTIAKGDIWHGVLCNRKKDGSTYWVQSTIAATSANYGKDRSYISIRTDITDVVNNANRLQKVSEELGLFKKIIESTSDAVSVFDENWTLFYANPARESLTGKTFQDQAGLNIADFIPPVSHRILRNIQNDVANGLGWKGLLPLKRQDGGTFIAMNSFGMFTEGVSGLKFAFNIFSDYTPELARQKEMENARNAAEVANRAKSKFLSNMSHELRTPLNSIIGFAQVMMADTRNALTDKQRGYMDYILSGGEHLLNLINEVLDLSKIEAGEISLSLEPMALHTALQECLLMTSPLFAKYDVTIVDETNECQSFILSDLNKTKQLIINLLSNAAKYNRPGGVITLSCESVEDRYHRLIIADTGYGIPDAKQHELFKPFSRLGAETTDIEGTGIGLALTKQMIEAMNGRIGFSSVEGQGSIFWLDFIEVGNFVIDPATQVAAEHFVPISDQDRLILYVEDNPTNVRLMESFFDELDHLRLVTANTGQAGVAQAESLLPDLILLDINLPDMNGFDVLDRLKANDKTHHIPVISLTADATEATRKRAGKVDFAAHLTKPVNLTALLKTIHHAIGKV